MPPATKALVKPAFAVKRFYQASSAIRGPGGASGLAFNLQHPAQQFLHRHAPTRDHVAHEAHILGFGQQAQNGHPRAVSRAHLGPGVAARRPQINDLVGFGGGVRTKFLYPETFG